MKQKQTGMTLIEILIVVLVVSVGMAATAKFQGELLQAGATTKARTQALAFVQNEVENLRINHGAAAAGSQDDVVAGNATYDVTWSVSPVAGLADTDQYTATVAWNDNQNRAQSVQLGTVLYADRMLGGGAADNVVRAEAVKCVFIDCLEGEGGPGVQIVNTPEAEAVTEDSGGGNDWDGVDDPQDGADSFGKNDEINLGADSDKVYLDQGSNKDIDLGDGDNILAVDGNTKNIVAGNGDDQLDIDGNINGDVDLGGGDNKFALDGNLNGDITAGAGDDVILLDGNANGTLIDLGNGNNVLELGGNLNANLVAGSGNDYIFVDGNANSGLLSLGDGDNWLELEGHSSMTITSGSGNDVVIINGNLNNAPLNLGAGNDYLLVSGNVDGNVQMSTGDDFVCVAGNTNGIIDAGSGSNDSIFLPNGVSSADLGSKIIGFENIKFGDGVVVGDTSAFDRVDADSACGLNDDFNPGNGTEFDYVLYQIDFSIQIDNSERFDSLDKDGSDWIVYLEDKNISSDGYDVISSDDGSTLELVFENYKGTDALERAFKVAVCSVTTTSCDQGDGSFTLKADEHISGFGDSTEFYISSRWYQQPDGSWVLELNLKLVDK